MSDASEKEAFLTAGQLVLSLDAALRKRGVRKVEWSTVDGGTLVTVTHEAGLYTAGFDLLEALANFDTITRQ